MNFQVIEIDKNIFKVKVELHDLVISRNEIEFSLGYDEGEIPEHFVEIIDDILLQVPNRCEVRAGYKIHDLTRPLDRNDGLIIGGIFFRMDRIVTSQLKNSEKAALFLCTIGSGMEMWSKQLLSDGNPTMSYFVDTVASVTVESVTNLLHERIGQKMNEHGLKITNRYSPGYCNWSVAEQQLLFSLLPENFCSVTLTESSLMLPIKSTSGIIGIGEAVEWKEYLCDKCGMKDCTYRAKRWKSKSK